MLEQGLRSQPNIAAGEGGGGGGGGGGEGGGGGMRVQRGIMQSYLWLTTHKLFVKFIPEVLPCVWILFARYTAMQLIDL